MLKLKGFFIDIFDSYFVRTLYSQPFYVFLNYSIEFLILLQSISKLIFAHHLNHHKPIIKYKSPFRISI